MVYPPSLMANLFKAPLFWFLITGSLFFLMDNLIRKQVDDNLITITDGDIQRIRDQWEAQSGTVLSDTLLNGLLEEDIQERRLYREALALGLEREDVIIKRRLIQKLRFLTEELTTFETPEQSILKEYFDKNRANYVSSAKVSFHHVYFSSESRGEAAKKDALKLYSDYKQQSSALDDWQNAGDPFMLGRIFNNRSMTDLVNQFGSDYTTQIASLSTKQWNEPIQSSFGYHLVWIEKHSSIARPTFDEVQLRLVEDYQSMRKQQVYQDYLETLNNKYPLLFKIDDEKILSTLSLSSTNKIQN